MKAITTEPLFGERMGRCLHLPIAPWMLYNAGAELPFALTHVLANQPMRCPSEPVQSEKAFTISVHLFAPNTLGCGTWMDGKFRKADQWSDGGVSICDLEANPIAIWPSAFEAVHIHLPRKTLETFAGKSDYETTARLRFIEREKDVFLHHWVRLLLPYLHAHSLPSAQDQEHYAHVLCSHLLQSYGTRVVTQLRHKGGLAPWQKRTIQTLIERDVAQRLRVSTLAAQCGLSVSHFSRAFRQSFEMPAHRYLLQCRVNSAKRLLLDAEKDLAEIALDAGFADQSTFCRTFSALTGTSPGRWRREAILHLNGVPVQSGFLVAPSRSV